MADEKTENKKPKLDDGLDLKELESLTVGRRGYQKEKGFQIVTNDPTVPGGITMIPLFAILCKSQRHPTPQLRFLSTFELERGVLEVADRVFGVRIPDPGSARSLLVVGRTDDVAEVATLYGKSRASSWLKKLVDSILGGSAVLLDKVGSILAKVTSKVEKL